MSRRRRPLLLLLLIPASAHAGGFEIPDNGTRALGRSGAFAVRADDPSAIYYNPAGLTRLERPTVLFNLNIVNLDYRFARARVQRTTRDGDDLFVPERIDGSLGSLFAKRPHDSIMTTVINVESLPGHQFIGLTETFLQCVRHRLARFRNQVSCRFTEDELDLGRLATKH